VARSVRTFLPLVGDTTALSTAFDEDPQRWLPGARRDGPDSWTLALRVRNLSRMVRATIGHPWRVGATRWRSIAWDPIAEDGDPAAVDRLLPSLDGELGLHLEPSGRVTLVLDARYQPPGGVFGEAVDAVGLHRLARATVERFLEELAARLAAEALLVGDAESADGDAKHDRRPSTIAP
jgi:hypothetical protein